MSFLNKLVESAKYLEFRDVIAPVVFLLVLPVAALYGAYIYMTGKKVWLVSEGSQSAQDNGYAFFSYVRENHPDTNIYYAIDKKSTQYQKVAHYDYIVQYGSLKHWVLYITASKNISNHKSASPNTPLFYVLHKYRLLNGHRVFLQHGVTMNNVNYLHFNETNFELFICGAKPEYEYVKENFGYPESRVAYLGFSRFDLLHQSRPNVSNGQIVIMPTWRSWLGRDLNILGGDSARIEDSQYFQHYQSLINNKVLLDFIEKNNLTIYFFQHANMEKFAESFHAESNRIKIVTSRTADIQELIRDSDFMVTDYSSVSVDFAYRNKPLAYYQFDESEFRKHHLSKGYFSYRRNGFGAVVTREDDLVSIITNSYRNGFVNEKKYLNRSRAFFYLRDANNSERIFRKISELEVKA